MIINLATNQINSKNPRQVTERDFWDIYLKVTVVNTQMFLTDAEYKVLGFVLSGSPHLSYFRGQAARELKAELNMGSVYLSKVRKNLLEKGYLVPGGACKRGDYVLSPVLRSFQKTIKQKGFRNIEISIPLTIEQWKQ